ncbi:MAG: class I SAM-dependent methyltransferase, partial [Erythrobacter sp.]|nr:class I SAM-dependent methyltransferase [Erythrobacter sp.]
MGGPVPACRVGKRPRGERRVRVVGVRPATPDARRVRSCRHLRWRGGDWARTSRRFRLEAAYRDPFAASGVANALPAPDARVLDCGIGCGSLSLALARRAGPAPDYHGIDISGAMLAAADAELRRAGIVARLRQADVRAIPYPDRSFDVVMAAHVLEHLPEPAVALREMTRVLKPGGVLLVCMTRRSAFGAIVQLRWRTWMVGE